MKKLIVLPAILSTALIQGCASFGMGESEFSCSGMPAGVTCKSSREMYELTHNGNVPAKMGAVEEAAEVSSEDETKIITDNYVAPSMPVGPVPIRTPAKVMRIWVAPYEDAQNDLHVSSYIYTEIESRRWLYDTDYSVMETNIQPLQTIPVAKKKETKAKQKPSYN